MGQRKTFCLQRIPEFGCVREETVGIGTLVISMNNKRKTKHCVGNQEQILHKNKKVEPVQPVQMNIYQRNTYRKGQI